MATTTTDKSETKDTKLDKADKNPAREHDPAREKAIDVAVSTIEKQFGKGSIMRLGEGMAPPEVKVIPTGVARARHRAGRGRAAARPGRRGVRP
jgi:hypothetical protein